MGVSPFIQRLRSMVGSDLLHLPSTSVIPRNDAGEILLVRLVDSGHWATIGGAVEPGETPAQCAVREAEEEAGVKVRLGSLLGCLGGDEYTVKYPNGDVTSYVVSVFDATVVSGEPHPDGDETLEVGWFRPDQLPLEEMGRLTKALVLDLDLVHPPRKPPLLVVVTGLPGTGKSTIADLVGTWVGGPVLAHDWVMSGLVPFPAIEETLGSTDPPGHGPVGWSILSALARAQLRAGGSVVLDGVARQAQIDALRSLGPEEGVAVLVVKTMCSDPSLHRTRLEGRERLIPDWHELEWREVAASMATWDPDLEADVTIDTSQPIEDGLNQVRDAIAGTHT